MFRSRERFKSIKHVHGVFFYIFSLVFWIRYIFFYGFFISLIVLILNSILHFKLFKNLHKVADMLHSTSLFKYHTKNSIYDVLIIQ